MLYMQDNASNVLPSIALTGCCRLHGELMIRQWVIFHRCKNAYIYVFSSNTQVIKARVKELQIPRFKVITLITIGSTNEQGMTVGSRCLWDASVDTFSSFEFRNKHLFAVGTVYGIYAEWQPDRTWCQIAEDILLYIMYYHLENLML